MSQPEVSLRFDKRNDQECSARRGSVANPKFSQHHVPRRTNCSFKLNFYSQKCRTPTHTLLFSASVPDVNRDLSSLDDVSDVQRVQRVAQ